MCVASLAEERELPGFPVAQIASSIGIIEKVRQKVQRALDGRVLTSLT